MLALASHVPTSQVGTSFFQETRPESLFLDASVWCHTLSGADQMPRMLRVAVQERLDAFYRDALSASEDDLDERMRAVATHGLQLPRDVVSALNVEKKYRAAMKHWDSYQAWKTHRNPARAELERQHGYDTKHAMHLIRLMRMGLEVLETGESFDTFTASRM